MEVWQSKDVIVPSVMLSKVKNHAFWRHKSFSLIK